MEEEKEIAIRNEAVNEILAAPPKWIIRWGITVVFMLIVIFLVLSALIRYPDKLSGQATLTTKNPTLSLSARAGGKLVYLPVKNNQSVKQHQVLCVFENPAHYTDVLWLDSVCSSINRVLTISDTLTVNDSLSTAIVIGELTPAYLALLKNIKDYNLFMETNLQNREIAILKRDLAEHHALLLKHQQQIDYSVQEFKLIEKDFLRDEILYGNAVIAAKDFEDKKRAFITAQKNLEMQKINLSNTRISINNIEKSILQLQIQQYEQKHKLRQELKQNLQSLVNVLADWKQKYVLLSPADGRISFFDYWNIHQTIKPGEEMFSLIPEQQEKIIAHLVLPAANAGKVKKGQPVHLKLLDFPYNEHGMINAVVENISLMPQKGNYNVEVLLTKGMITSYNKKLAYKPEMQAEADIITDNKTVLQRIFIQFYKLIH